MQKLLKVFAAVFYLFTASVFAQTTLTVGATAVPHAEILEVVKPMLAKEGIDLKIKVFNDYIQPNVQLDEKALDANFMQHQPYLDSFNKDRGTHLISVAKVHVEPLGVYSHKLKDLGALPEGANVAIPNDVTNGGRALLLLQKAGLIKLDDSKGILVTKRDIIENPKKIHIREFEAPMLPRVLDEMDLAIINSNYALQANLNPLKDALLLEDKDSPYANIVATRPELKDSPAIAALVKALHSDEVRNFIQSKYNGAVVPVF